MTPKQYAAFRIDEELLEGLERVWERDGVAVPEQVRRAIRKWLEEKGVSVKAIPAARATRRRSKQRQQR